MATEEFRALGVAEFKPFAMDLPRCMLAVGVLSMPASAAEGAGVAERSPDGPVASGATNEKLTKSGGSSTTATWAAEGSACGRP